MTHFLRYVALLAFLITPAHAQENPVFFGLWEPYSHSANAHSVLFEKGRLTYTSPYVDRTIYDYHIIRDFGDRLLVRSVVVEGDLIGVEYLEVFQLRDPNYDWDDDDPVIVLDTYLCSYRYALPDLFADKDPNVIWRKLMAWSAKLPVIAHAHHCALDEQGQFIPNSQWSGGGKYARGTGKK